MNGIAAVLCHRCHGTTPVWPALVERLAFRACRSPLPAPRCPLPAPRSPRCGAITSVTQKCQDIGDTFRPRRPVGGRDAVAVEQGVADEAARGICAAGPGAESMHGEAVSPIRDKPAERLQVG